DVPHTAHLLVEILLEAGLPPEVVQLVHGEGSVVGKAMVEHPEVPVVSFTGSTETGSVIGATCGRMHKRLSLEMGGKNAMLVMEDADLDLALEGAQVLIGGERPTGKGLERGWFYKPTVLAGVRAGMRVEQEEIFGPVLSVIKVASLDEAIAVNNDVKYGLSSSLYTRDVNAAFG